MSRYLDLGGTIRSQTAAQTLRKLKPLLPKFGITRVANITGLDILNIPVAISMRPNSKHLAGSQGKGLTWELAQVSAIMESIECYHAENPRLPSLYGAYEDFHKNNPLIIPSTFQNGFFKIPYLEKKPLDWVEAFDLVSQETVFIPHALVCMDSTQPHPEHAFFLVSSNGLAAGNEKEEAICHGIYEIIERDCLYRWASLPAAERVKTQIILESIDSSINQTLLESYAAHQIFIKVWDISSSVGIPAFHCVIQDSNVLRDLPTFRGTGAHISKDIALNRALTEAAQSRVTLISGSRDDIFFNHYKQQIAVDYTPEAYKGHKDYKRCDAPAATTSFSETIHELRRRIMMDGFKQILLVDHTKPDLNISTVHVFIPGMQFNGRRI